MPDDDPFTRGVAAGDISARLAGHDRHFASINGQIKRLADAQDEIKLQIQRIADAMVSDRQTVATTATAVEKERATTATAVEQARVIRRETTDQRWSPLARAAAVVSILAGAAAVIAVVVANLH